MYKNFVKWRNSKANKDKRSDITVGLKIPEVAISEARYEELIGEVKFTTSTRKDTFLKKTLKRD